MSRDIDNDLKNRFGGPRIADRQIDELIGLARGLAADGALNQMEVECLQKWLAANLEVSGEPLIAGLYRRVEEVLKDGVVDEEESKGLLGLLDELTSNEGTEVGEVLKSATLPLNDPMPDLVFPGQAYCFTGTFSYGQRHVCEKAVIDRGATVGAVTMKTNFLVVGAYATESWKHSSYGNKIIKACEYRDRGKAIAIVSENHWVKFLAS